MNTTPTARLYVGMFLVSLVTILTELLLMRAFDVILTPNLGYMVITFALFAFGLSGIYATLRPRLDRTRLDKYLLLISLGLAGVLLALLPVLNVLPFNFREIPTAPFKQLVSIGALFLALIIPFFLSGLFLTTVIAAYPHFIRRLYFWDLAGAAAGGLMMVPLLPTFGPGGLLFLAAALAAITATMFVSSRILQGVLATTAVIVALAPVINAPNYFELTQHMEKRGMKAAQDQGLVEFTHWDPVSKIDVVPLFEHDGTSPGTVDLKHVLYDGGMQSTMFFSFDGDYQRLAADPDSLEKEFWTIGLLASHYLYRNRSPNVLVIGSAGGQEAKAAVMYGARHVTGIELVNTIDALGHERYADFTGNVFNHPKVDIQHGEGRSYLRSTDARFDIIQIHSNHTTSSIANGNGALGPGYLQTKEAYLEYFNHLTDTGVLHINHYAYARMITTAALAWHELGRGDFKRHVVVYRRGEPDFLPTMLIRMKPWTVAELDELDAFLTETKTRDGKQYVRVEHPLETSLSFLPDEFYSGDLPDEIADRAGWRITPATDDRPYFGFLRNTLAYVEPDPDTYTNPTMAALFNMQKIGFVTMDTVHLLVTGTMAILFSVLFILLPMRLSRAGREHWHGKGLSILYFSCLGGGFIIIELMLIQMFMHFIGFPLHTYATVVFTMLLAAGIGSFASGPLGIGLRQRWQLPFLGTIGYGILLLVFMPALFDLMIFLPDYARIGVAGLMIFPLGFFLGMPFPLGILALEGKPQGAITWAWAMNGLFTVVGGLMSVLLSAYFGFVNTILTSLCTYLVAMFLLDRMRRYAQLDDRQEQAVIAREAVI